jgi:hypothetical protein
MEGEPKDHLKDLYRRLEAYTDRLARDLREATRHFSEAERGIFEIPKCKFADFCRNWGRVAQDPRLREAWSRRLDLGTYDERRATIRAALEGRVRLPGNRHTNSIESDAAA